MSNHRAWVKQTDQDFCHNEDDLMTLMGDIWKRLGISHSFTSLTTGDYSGTTDITVNAKTETKSNNCVLDERTGLIWSKGNSADIGPASDGNLYANNHVVGIEHDGAGGDFALDEVVTGAPSGATGVVIAINSTSDMLGLLNVTGGPFTAADTITGSVSGGPAGVDVVHAINNEDIWEYVYQANLAEFAGFNDWRIPTIKELYTLVRLNGGTGQPGSPFATLGLVFASTNFVTSYGHLYVTFASGEVASSTPSTRTKKAMLVRGPDLSKNRPCRPIKTGSYNYTYMQAFPSDGVFKEGVAQNFEVKNTGDYSGTTDIVLNGKTHSMSNAVVNDRNTGLMWTKDVTSGDIGPASDGKVLWHDDSGIREDAWEVVRLANEGALGGHKDWRLPNVHEAMSAFHYVDDTDKVLPSDYFDNHSAYVWTGSTNPQTTTEAYYLGVSLQGAIKTSATYKVRLVRGGQTDDDL